MSNPTTRTILEARRRIRQIRMTDVEIFVRKNGALVPNAVVSVKMRRHDFLFGAVCYKYGTYPTREENEKFTRNFTRLFNYTMVPFHWSWYEPRRNQFAEPYTGNLVDWAEENNLQRKLHALIWHECIPDWVTDAADVETLYRQRIHRLMQVYGDRFGFFDVINETTVNDRFDNPVSRWVKEKGPMEVMKFGTRLVRTYRPDAKLLYGDWNVHGGDYTQMLTQMREHDIDIDILGIQSHMHRDLWSQEETLRVMDNAAAFGWPLHFPECSVISGKPIGHMEYGAGAVNRFSETEEDAAFQADFTRDFYTLVFSHPAVEAISWFDFTDHRWLNAPAGVVDDNLDPKPVYWALDDLINHAWHSDAQGATNREGRFDARLFFGTYEITVQAPGQPPQIFLRELHRPSFYQGGGLRRIGINL